jgi:NAD(P)-dependent dehydrogenase (short-subunit alcohol dehydrogenase family)
MRVSRIADADMAQGDLLWRLHIGAPSVIMRHLSPLLPDQRGRVVLLGSRASLGRAGRGLYAASKAAVTGLARCWAIELVGRGVTVNVVAPGATDTPMLTAPDRGAPAQISLPIGRLIKAEEIAGTIAFLLGPDAGAMTGQTLFVCGGGSLA